MPRRGLQMCVTSLSLIQNGLLNSSLKVHGITLNVRLISVLICFIPNFKPLNITLVMLNLVIVMSIVIVELFLVAGIYIYIYIHSSLSLFLSLSLSLSQTHISTHKHMMCVLSYCFLNIPKVFVEPLSAWSP